jgi:hypothetical protein
MKYRLTGDDVLDVAFLDANAVKFKESTVFNGLILKDGSGQTSVDTINSCLHHGGTMSLDWGAQQFYGLNSSLWQFQSDLTVTGTLNAGSVYAPEVYSNGVPVVTSDSLKSELISAFSGGSNIAVTDPGNGDPLKIDFNSVYGVLPTSNTVWVSTTGTDTREAGDQYDPAKPFATLGQALVAATEGDTIHVMPGTYNEAGLLLKSGVDIYFSQGADMSSTSSTEPLFTDMGSIGDTACTIGGYGQFYTALAQPLLELTRSTSRVTVSADVMLGLGQVSTPLVNVGAGTLFLSVRKANNQTGLLADVGAATFVVDGTDFESAGAGAIRVNHASADVGVSNCVLETGSTSDPCIAVNVGSLSIPLRVWQSQLYSSSTYSIAGAGYDPDVSRPQVALLPGNVSNKSVDSDSIFEASSSAFTVDPDLVVLKRH